MASAATVLSCVLLHLLIHSDLGDCRYSRKDVARTIKTKYGDVYDCVDFYKQPAFDHPLLRNHTFYPEMKPSFTVPKRPKHKFVGSEDDTDDNNSIEVDSFRLSKEDGGGCPPATVPIARTKADDVVPRASRLFTPGNYIPNARQKQPGTHFAILQTKQNPVFQLYNGAGATISVYNPETVKPYYSSAEIIIQDGSDSIVVGWTVNPNVYKDQRTRLFAYSTTSESQCLNSQCGFVIVRSDISLHAAIKPISTRGGKIYDFTFFIYQDPITGAWWLELGRNHTAVGFWPSDFFSGLKHSASYVAFGGEVFGEQQYMGNGWYPPPPNPDPGQDAYFKNLLVVNEARVAERPGDSFELFTTKQSSYGIVDFRRRNGHLFFGGPLSEK